MEAKRIASIVGEAGMCSDDGRALTYSWRLFTSDFGGRGFWDDLGRFPSEKAARDVAAASGHEVIGVSWT